MFGAFLSSDRKIISMHMKKLLALVATVIFAVSTFAGEFPDVSIKEVQKLSDNKKAVIIDVNGSESFAKGHVPGALDFDAIKDNLAKALPADKDAQIVAYCGGPKCMAYQAAANAAKELGYKNIKHMSAGISGWKEAGMKLATK
jgi:rhodanese-related sulfurtransferase